MKIKKFRTALSALTLLSFWLMTLSVNAAPIRFSQVVQVVNAKTGKASTGGFTQLRLASDDTIAASDDDKDDAKKTATPPQDGRVIVETRSDIVVDDTCDCLQPPPPGGFPKYALLGLAAIPIAFILIHHHDDTPTPTPTVPGNTPTPPPPTDTPTPPPPTPTDTPTPPPSTPTPTPTPEPVTILLFSTGLAGVGFAARKRLGRKRDAENEETEI